MVIAQFGNIPAVIRDLPAHESDSEALVTTTPQGSGNLTILLHNFDFMRPPRGTVYARLGPIATRKPKLSTMNLLGTNVK